MLYLRLLDKISWVEAYQVYGPHLKPEGHQQYKMYWSIRGKIWEEGKRKICRP